MKTFKNILKWLDGKKTILFGILGLIIVFLLGQGYINENLAYFLQGILTLIGGGASMATKQLYTTKLKK